MSKTAKNSFSSILSVNPYKDTYLVGRSDLLSQTSSPEYDKEQYAISYLNSKDFITATISISKNIEDEDLLDAISNKAYDELALDQAILYQIKFIETFHISDNENRNFNVFIIDPLEIDNIFADSISKIKYIDTVIPSPLLIKSLYEKEIIEQSGVHCFIYFQENDAFLTIYNEKEFLYTKAINFSYIQMHERFCEIYGERVEYTSFIDFLQTQSLRNTKSNFKESFIKLNKEIFANLNDILTYVKRAYELEKIERIYIGSQIDTATKLDEMCEVELEIRSSDFMFNYDFDTNGVYVDQLHTLMQLYTILPKENKYDCNFTSYYRPPSFTKRESGKIILLTLISFIIAFAYPASFWTLTYIKTLEYDLLSSEYMELHLVKTDREKTIKLKKEEKAKFKNLVKIQQDEYAHKKATLIKIHDVKVNYPMKAKLIAKFIKNLNKFGVKVDSISYHEDKRIKTFVLNLVSENDKKITHLVEYLTKLYDKKFDFTVQSIEFKEEYKKYFSELKVDIL